VTTARSTRARTRKARESAAPANTAGAVSLAPTPDVVHIETADTPEPRISYAVARLERAVRAGIAERVRPYGLTTLQYTALSVLSRHGAPLSNAQLARRAYMTPQAMSEVIEALETNGFIRRNPHPTHGRLLPATLTAKGRRVLADCERRVDEMESVMLADLNARERLAFRKALKSAVRALGAGFPQGLK
jgi:DNA-binding MarR family transcriptional regulator